VRGGVASPHHRCFLCVIAFSALVARLAGDVPYRRAAQIAYRASAYVGVKSRDALMVVGGNAQRLAERGQTRADDGR